MSAVAAILAVDRRVIPATVNLDTPGEGCDLDYVPKHARDATVDVVMSNSFGFGGHNTSLVFRRA